MSFARMVGTQLGLIWHAAHHRQTRGRPARRGQTLVEYALILGLLAIALLGAMLLFRDTVVVIYNFIVETFGSEVEP